ncbi:MAG: restriction endonuclease subunit S [Bacteroidetes bacterium]|nr:restriction endonuclease subunit S [Bacteroidota bacterium]
MFGDPVRNEKGWDKVRLGDICNKIGSGATPRGGKENYKLDGIRLIRSLNVHNNQFEYENLAFIDDGQANLLSNVIVEQDDVLLNITGASVARCCIVPDNVLPARVNQHVAIIRPDDKILNPYFLNRLITTDRFQTFLVKNSKKKGATREAITKDEIEALNICVPPIDNQNRFTRIVEKVESLKAEYNNSLKEIENLYGSLSQRAFKGELNLSTIQVQLSKKEKPGINTTDLHAGIIAKIIYLHSLNPKHELTLGHVKAEKISHIIESHLNIDLGRNPKRIAAGPADFTHIKKVEHRAKMKNWFAVYKREGTSGYKYNLGKNYNNLLEITSNELGSREAEIDKIINLFLKQDSHQAEVVATTYAAWNDLLIEGKNPSDAEIIKEARLNWTESKLKISEDKFLKSIEWLRKKKLIPAGKGKHTIPTSDI